MRELLIRQRTQAINALRGHLTEFGQIVPQGAANATRLGAVGFDAVKHLVLCQVEKRPPKLDLDVYPHLPKADVGTTSAASYMSLLRGQAA